jgi:hypothetical protein
MHCPQDFQQWQSVNLCMYIQQTQFTEQFWQVLSEAIHNTKVSKQDEWTLRLFLGPERAQAQARVGLVYGLIPQARPRARPQARPGLQKPEPAV